jgi:hypothetical protein
MADTAWRCGKRRRDGGEQPRLSDIETEFVRVMQEPDDVLGFLQIRQG